MCLIFRNSFPVVTLYTNLGDEAIAHGINQTEVGLHGLTHTLTHILHTNRGP